jgi:hypothetical protein
MAMEDGMGRVVIALRMASTAPESTTYPTRRMRWMMVLILLPLALAVPLTTATQDQIVRR